MQDIQSYPVLFKQLGSAPAPGRRTLLENKGDPLSSSLTTLLLVIRLGNHQRAAATFPGCAASLPVSFFPFLFCFPLKGRARKRRGGERENRLNCTCKDNTIFHLLLWNAKNKEKALPKLHVNFRFSNWHPKSMDMLETSTRGTAQSGGLLIHGHGKVSWLVPNIRRGKLPKQPQKTSEACESRCSKLLNQSCWYEQCRTTKAID